MNIDVLAQMRNKLIEARTKEEQRVEEFGKSISSVNIEEVFGDTCVPPVITLRALCPEAYADVPNPDQYDKEFENMSKIFTAMNEKIIAYNSEAMELLQQFKMMDQK
jgi:hypothetical protein